MTALLVATMFPASTVAAGDEANAAALLRRAARRGIDAEHVTIQQAGDDVEADIYLLGGCGRESAAALVALLDGGSLAARVREGRAAVLAVDAGLDALARTCIGPDGRPMPGLGLLDVEVRPGRGVFATVVTSPNPRLGLPPLLGWISTDVTTRRSPQVAPLARFAGKTRHRDPDDGAVTDRIVATRLHGPVLAINPELADLVLASAPGVDAGGWRQLPEPEAERARAQRIAETRTRRRHT